MSVSEATAAANGVLEAVVNTLDMQYLQVKRLAIYALLLKAMVLRWQGDLTTTNSLAEIVRFSLDVIGKFAKTEIYFAWKLLGGAGALPRFFASIANPSTGGLGKLRGISWDLAMLRMAELMATMPRQTENVQSDFFVPFVASYDERFKQLVDACPLKAIVIDPVGKQVHSIFRDEMSFTASLSDAMDDALKAILNNRRNGETRRAAEFDKVWIKQRIVELEMDARRLSR